MGIPYSREINAAFGQVTPLVAAGFKVLRTMKDISILLATVQVLTVFILALILFVLVLLVYAVNPDLEYERQRLVTPLLRALAALSLWDVFKSAVSTIAGIVLVLGATLWVYRLGNEESRDLERAADEDAEEALESITEEKDKKKRKKKGKKGEKEEEDKEGN